MIIIDFDTFNKYKCIQYPFFKPFKSCLYLMVSSNCTFQVPAGEHMVCLCFLRNNTIQHLFLCIKMYVNTNSDNIWTTCPTTQPISKVTKRVQQESRYLYL